jgi:hypothetical protein
LKNSLIIPGLLLMAVMAVAKPLGFTVGSDLSFGNVFADNYQFAGKADPAWPAPAGLGSIRPYIIYDKAFGAFSLNTYLSNNFGFDNPETTDFKFGLTGTYNLVFNNKASMFSFTLDNLLRLRSYDGSLRVEDGALGWGDVITPAGVKYTHNFKFGSVYGKFAIPLSFSDPAFADKFAPLIAQSGQNPDDYKKTFVFGIPEIGLNTVLGIGIYMTSNIQIFPDRKQTSLAPAYEKYASDIAIQQINLGIGYITARFAGSVLFEFPIPGQDMKQNGIKDQGFAITPTCVFMIPKNIRLLVNCEFINIGKDTGSAVLDKIEATPTISLAYGF